MSRTHLAWLATVIVGAAGCQKIASDINFTGVTVSNTAKVMKDEVVSKSFQVGATPKVIVDVFSGAVTVNPGADASVAAEVTKRAGGETEEAAREMLKKIDLQTTQDGDTVRITAKIPSGITFIGDASAKVTVPAAAVLELHSGFGAVSVNGVNGAIDARTNNGAVTVRDGAGPLKLHSDFGGIEARGPFAGVMAQSANGAITIRDAKGDLDLKSGFGKIDVEANCARVTATSDNGAVTVKQAKGPLLLKSGFGEVRAEPAGGEVTAESDNGRIYVRGASGRLSVKSGFGGLDLGAENANVSAESANGTVTFVGSLADGESRIHSGFGNVSVTLPAAARFRLDARTGFGSVTNGFKLTTTSQATKDHVQGTVGESPAVVLHVSSANGQVRVSPK